MGKEKSSGHQLAEPYLENSDKAPMAIASPRSAVQVHTPPLIFLDLFPKSLYLFTEFPIL